MSTPDSVKYSNTPTATENVWGVGLKDAKRQSRSTAMADVAQSVTVFSSVSSSSATWLSRALCRSARTSLLT